nr:hypothetical protein [Tanacetum cinerariifolium]
MILGRPFLVTIHAEIDIYSKEISLETEDDMVTFDMDKKIHNFTTRVGKGRSNKKARMLKPDSNTPRTHFCKPVQQKCNGILKMWPTCDPTMKLCYEGNGIYGVDEQGSLKYWHCHFEDERKSMKGGSLSFPNFFLVKYEINQGDVIMEYLVKISKKAHIMELERRNMKKLTLISYMPYPSRKIRRIYACTSQKTMKE